MFGPPSCAIMVLFGMRWSRVAFTSPRTLPILSYSFGTSSQVSSREGSFLLNVISWHLNFGTLAESLPRVHAVTLLDTLLLTRNESKVLPEGGLSGTHVVYGDRSFDHHDPDSVLFAVTAEEIRWLQSGVVVPHVTVCPHRRRRHLRQRARRERCSRTRQCGALVLSSVRPSSSEPSRTSAVSGLLRKKGCPSRFAVPPAWPPDSSTWTRPPRSPCAPASTASFSMKIERRFMRRGWLTGFGTVNRVAPSTKNSCSLSSSSGRLRGRIATRSNTPCTGTRHPLPLGLLLGAPDSELTSPTTTTWNPR